VQISFFPSVGPFFVLIFQTGKSKKKDLRKKGGGLPKKEKEKSFDTKKKNTWSKKAKNIRIWKIEKKGRKEGMTSIEKPSWDSGKIIDWLQVKCSPLSRKYILIAQIPFPSKLTSIFIVRHKKTSQQRILKRICKKNTNRDMIENEWAAGRTLRHNRMVRIYERLDTFDYIFFVMEFAQGLDLFTTYELKKFVPLPEIGVKHIAQQLLDVLSYCHSKGVAHRDIKLENIMLDRKARVKLIDFGLCCFPDTTDPTLEKWCGTMSYVAPVSKTSPFSILTLLSLFEKKEILCKEKYDPYKGDVWSFGVIIYALLYGAYPYGTDDIVKRRKNQVKDSWITWDDEELDWEIKISQNAKDLITRMMNIDPDKRLTMGEVKRHEWFLEDNLLSIPDVLSPEQSSGKAQIQEHIAPKSAT